MTEPSTRFSVNGTTSDIDDATLMTSVTDPTRNDGNVMSNDPLLVKFEFKVHDKGEFAACDIHRQLLSLILSSHPTTKFFTNKSEKSTITPSATCDDFFHHFNYQTFTKKKFHLVCVAHKLQTKSKFNDVKDSCKSLLHKYNGYIRIHKWKEHELDIVSVGWLYGANPKRHSRDHIVKNIKKLSELHNLSFVPMELYSKTISNAPPSDKSRINTSAINISCRRSDAKQCKALLQHIFKVKSKQVPGKFIPNDISSSESFEVFTQYIKLQNKYLQNHRSISVVGISEESLCDSFVLNGKTTSLLTIARSQQFFTWVSKTRYTSTTGRIVFSTDAANYDDAIQWIDEVFLVHHSKLPHIVWPKDFQSTAAHRTFTTTTTKNLDEYTVDLITNVSPLSDVSYSKPPNSWERPIKIVTTSVPQDQPSAYSKSQADTQVSALTDLVSQLQNELKTQAKQHAHDMEQQNQKHKADIESLIDRHLSTFQSSKSNSVPSSNESIEAIVQRSIDRRVQSLDEKFDKLLSTFQAVLSNSSSSRPSSPTSTSTSQSVPKPPGSNNKAPKKKPRTNYTQDIRRALTAQFSTTEPSQHSS